MNCSELTSIHCLLLLWLCFQAVIGSQWMLKCREDVWLSRHHGIHVDVACMGSLCTTPILCVHTMLFLLYTMQYIQCFCCIEDWLCACIRWIWVNLSPFRRNNGQISTQVREIIQIICLSTYVHTYLQWILVNPPPLFLPNLFTCHNFRVPR